MKIGIHVITVSVALPLYIMGHISWQSAVLINVLPVVFYHYLFMYILKNSKDKSKEHTKSQARRLRFKIHQIKACLRREQVYKVEVHDDLDYVLTELRRLENQ